MARRIIQIDRDKCVGCGLCTNACHEKAIALVDGKAKLIRDDFCDGLGNCLPACPVDAIHFVEREGVAYDYAEVQRHKQQFRTQTPTEYGKTALRQWPVQIKLVPTKTDYFDQAKLLVSADCSAYAYANFHEEYIKGRVTLIGCPKLDEIDYTEKLAEIIKNNDIKEIMMARMEVPCCAGIEIWTKNAIKLSGKIIPWDIVTFTLNGHILH